MNTSPLGCYYGRPQFQQMSATRYTDVALPDGGKVRIRSLSEGELARHEVANVGKNGGLNKRKTEETRRRLFALVVVDEQGNRLYAGSKQDLEEIKGYDGGIVDAVYEAAKDHCGFTDGYDAGDTAKNSETTNASSSSSS